MNFISLKTFLQTPKINFQSSQVTIVVDISKEDFLKNIVYLYHHLLYPLKNKNIKVTIQNDPFTYSNMSIAPELIHTNKEAVKMHLYLEAWYRLLKAKEQPFSEHKKYLIESLNKDQQKAIRSLKGPVLLLAPAGSGKTKTLINRVLALLNQGIDEKEILVLTYNKKAEQELKERLPQNIQVDVRTFHSFGNQILKQYTDFEFYSEDPCEFENILLERVISKQGHLIYGKEKDPFKSYREKLAEVKNKLLDRTQMIYYKDHQKLDFYPIFKAYLKELQEEKLYDYDDMLYLAVLLLLKEKEVRKNIQNHYRYLLVDEFQDLNPLQLELLEIISLPQNNLFVVGDDDQMIYSFRGASVKPLLSFQKNYPTAKILKLSTNYRSSKRMVYHASNFINHNIERFPKDIKASVPSLGKVEVKIANNLLEEARQVSIWIENIPNEPITILYRYQAYGNFLKMFFGLAKSDTYFTKLDLFIDFFTSEYNISKAHKITNLLHLSWSTKLTSWDTFFATFETTSFKKIYTSLQKKDLPFRRFCLLLQVPISFFLMDSEIDEKELLSFMEPYITSLGGVKAFYQERKKTPQERPYLTFATIHKTKGNEFKNVVYFHMAPPNTKEILEEERRISYVALTRAKESLLITTDSKSYSSYVREYLENKKYQDFTKNTLQELYNTRQLDLQTTKNRLLLLTKDHQTIEKNITYNVRESVNTYYHRQTKDLEKLEEEIKIEEENIFEIGEEVWARSLKPVPKYAIMRSDKGSGTDEEK